MIIDPADFGYLPITEVDDAVLSSFTCGKETLDGFLTQGALSQHRARLGFTSVVFTQRFEGPVGYFTLANDAIPLEPSERFELGFDDSVSMSAIPAIKICRLAVHAELQGSGVGAFLLKLIVGDALNAEATSTGRLLVVDADNDSKVRSFYEKNGFVESLWANRQAKNHVGAKGRRTPRTIKMHRDILTPIA